MKNLFAHDTTIGNLCRLFKTDTSYGRPNRSIATGAQYSCKIFSFGYLNSCRIVYSVLPEGALWNKTERKTFKYSLRTSYSSTFKMAGNVLGRMSVLIFWTSFVCIVFYASQWSRVFMTSRDSDSSHRSSDVDEMSTFESKCMLESGPSEDNIRVMKRQFYQKGTKPQQPFVHCSVVKDCHGNAVLQVDCFSSTCSSYTVRLVGGGTLSAINSSTLSDLVLHAVSQEKVVDVENLSDRFSLMCLEGKKLEMIIASNVVYPPNCNSLNYDRDVNSSQRSALASNQTHIHLFYFRFLSNWDIAVRLPGLESLLEKAARDGRAVLRLNTHQATRWSDDENISLLFRDVADNISEEHSVFQSLQFAGFCVRLGDFSCSRSREKERFEPLFASFSPLKCEGRYMEEHETSRDMMCTAGNLTQDQSRDVLTSLMADIHAVSGFAGLNSQPSLSVSILDTSNWENVEVLDLALRSIFLSLLTDEDNVIVMVSDVGNPRLLGFDQNLRLQLQASNPVFRLISAGTLSISTLSEVSHLNQTFFSLRDVRGFISRLIDNEGNSYNAGKQYNNITMDTVLPQSESKLSACARLGVRPPFMCLCEDEYVLYENDTLAAGFAEFTVGLINSRLKTVSTAVNQHGARTARECARLSGIQFTSVRIGHKGWKKQYIMDLKMEAEGWPESLERHAVLETWDMDKIPKARVFFIRDNFLDLDMTKGFLSDAPTFNDQSESLFKTLCNNEENMDFRATSERNLLKRLSDTKHFGLQPMVLHLHDDCLYMFVRDHGDSVSVETSNVCRDRHYDVMLHLSLMNMVSLLPLPIFASLGHTQTEFLVAIVKVAYTVSNFAYKLHPDFTVTYDK